jgi:hypothetical protein
MQYQSNTKNTNKKEMQPMQEIDTEVQELLQQILSLPRENQQRLLKIMLELDKELEAKNK